MTRARGVLVVEDDEDAAEILCAILASLGRACRSVRDGREAIRAAHELRPELVLLDIELPDLSGFEIARILRDPAGGTGPILVALTGYSDSPRRACAVAAGFDQYLVKPVTIETIEKLMAWADARTLRIGSERQPIEGPLCDPRAATMHERFVMYTTTYCWYCERARRVLRARKIPFDEIDVTNDPARRRQVIAQTGHRTVPVILLDGQLLGGSDELVDLERAGGLDGFGAAE